MRWPSSCTLLVVATLLCAVVCQHAVQAVPSEVIAQSNKLFRLESSDCHAPTASSPGANSSVYSVDVTVFATQLPALPAWLSVDVLANSFVLSGRAPSIDATRSTVLTIRCVQTANTVAAVTLHTITLTEQPFSSSTREVTFVVRSHSRETLLGDSFAPMRSALTTVNAALYIASIQYGEKPPRISPTNLHPLRAGSVTVGTRNGEAVATCSELASHWPAPTFVIEWSTCAENEVVSGGQSSSETLLKSVNKVSFARSSSDFNATVTPALVIALILLGIGLGVFLISIFCAPRRTASTKQMESFVVNRLARSRGHTMRQAAPKIHSGRSNIFAERPLPERPLPVYLAPPTHSFDD
eukprot:m.77668 g.77668  ORF g.77668 m.77668 type:complete len:355 (-) comp14711_c0_seq1:236-1300(-)